MCQLEIKLPTYQTATALIFFFYSLKGCQRTCQMRYLTISQIL